MMYLSKSDSTCHAKTNEIKLPLVRNTSPIRNDIETSRKFADQFLPNRKERKPKCHAVSAEQIMRQKMQKMKDDYKKICTQEATLRNHIALLSAELILMQTKSYHKSPAEVRKITIDPIEIRRLDNKEKTMDIYAVKRPPLVQRQTTSLTKENIKYPVIKQKSLDQKTLPIEKQNKNTVAKQTQSDGKLYKPIREASVMEQDNVSGSGSYFTFPPPVVRPPYITVHRSLSERIASKAHKKFRLPKVFP